MHESVLSEVGICLQLLLDHVHILHICRVHAVVFHLRHVPFLERTVWVQVEELLANFLLISFTYILGIEVRVDGYDKCEDGKDTYVA